MSTYTDGFNAGLEAAAQLVAKNWIDHGVLRPVPAGSLECTTRGGYADAIRNLSRVPEPRNDDEMTTCPDCNQSVRLECESCSWIESKRNDDGEDCPGCSQCGPPIMVTAEEGCLR